MVKLEIFDKSAYAILISWIRDEEMLMQFGGPNFTFPLTNEQLDKSLGDNNRFAFNVVDVETNKNIGHCEIYLLDDAAKLARILIGDESKRGKGIGTQIVNQLIEYVFANLDRNKIELNVFDWNTAAIKCYERVGFRINPDKKLERTVNGKTWIAINMVLDNESWHKNKETEMKQLNEAK